MGPGMSEPGIRPDAADPTGGCDVVRRFCRALTERDLRALLATLDPGVAFEPVLGVLYDQHVFTGHAEMTRWFEQLLTQWDAFEGSVERAVVVDDHVVALIHLAARGGGETLEAQLGAECRFAGGRIVSLIGRDVWEIADEIGLTHAA
jgi:ketosteroid isomerase-like protein